jgi:hypothetical protein
MFYMHYSMCRIPNFVKPRFLGSEFLPKDVGVIWCLTQSSNATPERLINGMGRYAHSRSEIAT